MEAGRAFIPVYRRYSPLLHARAFAFYRGSVRQPDVAVKEACTVARPANCAEPRSLWLELRPGLSEEEYKDIAARVEKFVTRSVADYESEVGHQRNSQVKVSSADLL